MHRRRSTTTKSGWTCTSASSSTGRSTDPSGTMKSAPGRLYFHAGLSALAALTVLACSAQTLIYEKASSYNTIIVTEDHRGLRTLLFEKGGGRQSVVKPGDPDHLELPYARVALAGLALCEEPRRILVVGLGGGRLPMFLRGPDPGATSDGGEIGPHVGDRGKRLLRVVQ